MNNVRFDIILLYGRLQLQNFKIKCKYVCKFKKKSSLDVLNPNFFLSCIYLRQVKRFVIVFDGLQLLIVLVLVINGHTVSFIACIRYSSWVCAITCEVAEFRYDTLTTYIDVLGVLATLPHYEVWADIQAEPCRTSVTTRELELLSVIIGCASAMLKQAWHCTRLAR